MRVERIGNDTSHWRSDGGNKKVLRQDGEVCPNARDDRDGNTRRYINERSACESLIEILAWGTLELVLAC